MRSKPRVAQRRAAQVADRDIVVAEISSDDDVSELDGIDDERGDVTARDGGDLDVRTVGRDVGTGAFEWRHDQKRVVAAWARQDDVLGRNAVRRGLDHDRIDARAAVDEIQTPGAAHELVAAVAAVEIICAFAAYEPAAQASRGEVGRAGARVGQIGVPIAAEELAFDVTPSSTSIVRVSARIAAIGRGVNRA